MKKKCQKSVVRGGVRILLVFIGCLLLLCCSARAQVGEVYKGFKLLDYYQPTPGKSQTNSLKSQITGAEAQPQAGGLVLVKKVRIENYLENGATNLTATAPECLVDSKRRLAYSTSQLQVQTVQGQLAIQGQGFLYEQTNFNLTISNQVETTIHRQLIRATNAGNLPLLVNANQPRDTQAVIRVFSEQFFLEASSNLAYYSGQVRVDDPQIALTCETLTLRRATNGPLESIVADQNVIVTNKPDASYATGDRAIYSLEPEKELVVLTGRDARWHDGEREGKAGIFTFDRRANILRAEQNPWMKLPRAAFNQADWVMGNNKAHPNPGPLTNSFVEITAGTMLVRLPGTNEPFRRVTMYTNVIIISPADRSRTTCDQAVYDEALNSIELAGHAVWEAEERLIKGDRIAFVKTNQTMTVDGGAYLKIPLASLRGPVSAAATSATLTGPSSVEVFSENAVFGSTDLVFHENVRANYLQGETRRGWVTCEVLQVKLDKQRIENIAAKGDVIVSQPFFGTNEAHHVDRKLTCGSLRIQFHTNELVQNIFAESNVVAQQDELRRGRPLPIRTQLTADRAEFFFASNTNQLEEIVAEKDVTIVQEARKARGQRAVYNATNQVIELTGNPTAEMPMGRITHAQALIWDQAHNTLSAKALGTKVLGEWQVPSNAAIRIGPFLGRPIK